MIETRSTHTRSNPCLDYLLVAAVAFVVFMPWIQGYFLGDDWMLLARNSGRTLPPQLGFVSDISNSRWYRPLSELSLACSWRLFDLNPVGHHVINLALHGLNAVLVAVLGQRLAQDRRVGLLAGLSFAVLACHTEAVVWSTARHEMLASAFALFSMISYIKFRESNQYTWWGGAFLSYVVGLGFKETILVLPLFLALNDVMFVFPLRRSRPWHLEVRQLLPLLPPLVVGTAYLVFRLRVGGGYNVPLSVVGPPKNLVYYLLMEAVALPASTRFLFRFPLVTLPVIVALAVACALGIWLARGRFVRHRTVWFGASWMVFALAPVILIVAERTTYFSSVGWSWTVGTILTLAWDATSQHSRSFKRWLPLLVVVVILGANLVTLTHRGYWWDRAADVSYEVFSQVQTALLRLPPGKGGQLWFFNFPDQIEYAYAFGDRILFAVWLLEGQPAAGTQVLIFRDVEVNAPSPEHLEQWPVERAVDEPVVAFYWQEGPLAGSGTFERVFAPDSSP